MTGTQTFFMYIMNYSGKLMNLWSLYFGDHFFKVDLVVVMSSCLTFPDVLVTVLCREMCNSFPYQLPTHNCSLKRFFLNLYTSSCYDILT